ncbi:MAG: anti-sigma regulatory factor [Clostridia bacterium]|jgi:anti-sigma regulatory factor (Ser/Thr protein kinase)|nr:anti-sigma regulatory factor [Clostridia bacterium]
MGESIKLRYDVNGEDFVTCGQASEDVKRTLKGIGIPSATIRRVSIAMYEGEINMVIHGGGGVAEVEIFESKITIVLKDTGKGIADIEKAMQEGYSTATEDIRELGFGAGMGLPNMKKYSDEFAIESRVGQGTTVTMTINFQEDA